jgi:hypothetical protein
MNKSPIDDTASLQKGSMRIFIDGDRHLLKGWDGHHWLLIFDYTQSSAERDCAYREFETKFPLYKPK